MEVVTAIKSQKNVLSWWTGERNGFGFQILWEEKLTFEPVFAHGEIFLKYFVPFKHYRGVYLKYEM